VEELPLRRRLKGGNSLALEREPQQLLSNDQEKKLKKWITDLEAQGHAPSFSQIRELIAAMNGASGGPTQVGKNWASRFLRRHPDIRSKVGRKILIYVSSPRRLRPFRLGLSFSSVSKPVQSEARECLQQGRDRHWPRGLRQHEPTKSRRKIGNGCL